MKDIRKEDGMEYILAPRQAEKFFILEKKAGTEAAKDYAIKIASKHLPAGKYTLIVDDSEKEVKIAAFIDNKDYRTHEDNKNYTNKGKGEGKWQDFRTSQHTEAAKNIDMTNFDDVYGYLKIKLGDKFSDELLHEYAEIITQSAKEGQTVPINQWVTMLSKLPQSAERNIPWKRRRDEVPEEEQDRIIDETFEMSKELMRRKSAIRRIIKKMALKKKIAALKKKLASKKKAAFDPRLLTDLNPEKGFGPAPEMASEKQFKRKPYGTEFADDGKKRKPPEPNTQNMIKDKREVEKAYTAKAIKVSSIVDEMISKGLIKVSDKEKEIERLMKMDIVELEKIASYVKKASKEPDTVLVKDNVIIDFSKIVGD